MGFYATETEQERQREAESGADGKKEMEPMEQDREKDTQGVRDIGRQNETDWQNQKHHVTQGEAE